MHIRRFRPADRERVIELHRVAMQAIGCYIDHGHINDDLNDIEGVYLNNHGEFIVGVLDDRIIAMGGFRPYGDGIAEVKRMRVDPGHQGRGYGRRILEALEAKARKMGYTGFTLETSVIQLAARRLYTKFGFIEAGHEIIDGFDCIRFRKDFPPD